MSVGYVVMVTAYTPRGEFHGTWGDPSTLEEASNNAVLLGSSINQAEFLSLRDGKDNIIILNKHILAETVLSTKISSVMIRNTK